MGRHRKFRPYLRSLSIPLAVFGVLTFTYIPGLSANQTLLFAYVTYIAYLMLYTGTNIPFGSMASVMTDDGAERSQLSIFRTLGAGVGGLPAALLRNRLFMTICLASTLLIAMSFYTQAVYNYLYKDYFLNPKLYTFVTMASGDAPHWNPVLFPFRDRLFLYYKKGKPIPRWYTCLRVLQDGKWSEPDILVPGDLGGRGPVKNKPILLKKGTICAPASLEYKRRPIRGRKWQAFADSSRDGLSWQAQKPIPAGADLIQPSFWESATGLHALLRSDAGAIYRSDSRDGGITWSKARATKLPNNNSGIDTAYDGRVYVVYNPVGKNWGPRTPLAVSVSQDDGATWGETLLLEDAKGEYSYPSMIAADGALHVVYTHQRRGIVYAKVLL